MTHLTAYLTKHLTHLTKFLIDSSSLDINGMPSKLPNHLKSLVIQQWLSGTQRDRIAAENGLSAGAVTNLVNEWSRGLGFAIAEDLRELAVTMKKVGITAAQCASGFRAAMIMNKI